MTIVEIWLWWSWSGVVLQSGAVWCEEQWASYGLCGRTLHEVGSPCSLSPQSKHVDSTLCCSLLGCVSHVLCGRCIKGINNRSSRGQTSLGIELFWIYFFFNKNGFSTLIFLCNLVVFRMKCGTFYSTIIIYVKGCVIAWGCK